jgi:hypothetical protein
MNSDEYFKRGTQRQTCRAGRVFDKLFSVKNLRVAKDASEEVAAAIELCVLRVNALVHQLMVDIVAKLPPELARDLAIRETG